MEPGEPGSGLLFEPRIKGGSIPLEYVPSVRAGIQEAMATGPLAGYPIEDVKVALLDGSYHEVDSSEMAFKVAGSMAFKEGARKASPYLMEPIMRLEVVVPEQYMGNVIADLHSHRGDILGINPRSDAQVVNAVIPLSETFGYATRLRSLTQGRAVFTMQFEKYQEVPRQITDELVSRISGQ
jgi:elongation factor G